VTIKHIWLQYCAKPLIQLAKEKQPELFAELNALPGLASAALSQQFSTQGFTYLRCKALMENNDNPQGVKVMQYIINLIMSGEYGDDGFAEKRKENNKKLNDAMKNDGEAQGRIYLDVRDIADAAADNDDSSDLAQEMMKILTAVYNYILKEYGDQGRVNVLTGSARYTSNYKLGRSSELGQSANAFRQRQFAVLHPKANNEQGWKADRAEDRKRLSPIDYAIYEKFVGENNLAANEYPFRQAWKEWKRNAPDLYFIDFLEAKSQEGWPKNQ